MAMRTWKEFESGFALGALIGFGGLVALALGAVIGKRRRPRTA